MDKCKCDKTCTCGCQEGKECTCEKECTCGCQEGKECTCGDDCHCGDLLFHLPFRMV